MPACGRCGEGTRRGRGRGWCSNSACRKAEQEEKEEAKAAALPPCDRCGGKKRGRREGYCDNKACREAKKEEEKAAKQVGKEQREEKEAGERGPCPGEGVGGTGRPADSKEVQTEKLEARGVNQVG